MFWHALWVVAQEEEEEDEEEEDDEDSELKKPNRDLENLLCAGRVVYGTCRGEHGYHHHNSLKTERVDFS